MSYGRCHFDIAQVIEKVSLRTGRQQHRPGRQMSNLIVDVNFDVFEISRRLRLVRLGQQKDRVRGRNNRRRDHDTDHRKDEQPLTKPG